MPTMFVRQSVPDYAHGRSVFDTVMAPATMPATSEATSNPEFAPLSVGTVKCSSASPLKLADSTNAITGTRPADDTRFGFIEHR
jgi:hypothetical protein